MNEEVMHIHMYSTYQCTHVHVGTCVQTNIHTSVHTCTCTYTFT